MNEAALVTGAAWASAGRSRSGSSATARTSWPSTSLSGEAVCADLTQRVENRAAVDAALERFGRLDAVLPNAGFQHVAAVDEFDEDRWAYLHGPTGAAFTGAPLVMDGGWTAR